MIQLWVVSGLNPCAILRVHRRRASSVGLLVRRSLRQVLAVALSIGLPHMLEGAGNAETRNDCRLDLRYSARPLAPIERLLEQSCQRPYAIPKPDARGDNRTGFVTANRPPYTIEEA